MTQVLTFTCTDVRWLIRSTPIASYEAPLAYLPLRGCIANTPRLDYVLNARRWRSYGVWLRRK